MAVMQVAVQSPTIQKCRRPSIRVPVEAQEKRLCRQNTVTQRSRDAGEFRYRSPGPPLRNDYRSD